MYKIVAIKLYGEYYEKRTYLVKDYEKHISESGDEFLILTFNDHRTTLAVSQFDSIDIKREY